MKTTKTTKKEDENENNEEEERVSLIRFELCWWIQEEHCEYLSQEKDDTLDWVEDLYNQSDAREKRLKQFTVERDEALERANKATKELEQFMTGNIVPSGPYHRLYTELNNANNQVAKLEETVARFLATKEHADTELTRVTKSMLEERD